MQLLEGLQGSPAPDAGREGVSLFVERQRQFYSDLIVKSSVLVISMVTALILSQLDNFSIITYNFLDIFTL